MKASIIDFKEAYDFYVSCTNIDTTQKVFKKRRLALIKEWKLRGYEYPVKKVYPSGYTVDRPPRINKNLNTTYFKQIDTSEKAYFLGLIAADGNVHIKLCKDRGNRYDFRLSLKEDDKYLLEKFNNVIGNSLSIKTTKEKLVSVKKSKSYMSSKHCIVSIYNREFVTSLVNLGILPNKSHLGIDTSKIPTKYISDFIRGYFDGDGCIGVYERSTGSLYPICYICSNEIRILQFIKQYLPENIDCFFSFSNGMHYLKIKTNSVLKFYNFIKDESLCLERKKLKFEKFRTYVEQSTLANSVNSGKGEIPNPEPSTIEIL
jgi:hypothetical protein